MSSFVCLDRYQGRCIQIFIQKSVKLRELFNIEGGAENSIETFLTKSKKHRQEKFLENWVIWIGEGKDMK